MTSIQNPQSSSSTCSTKTLEFRGLEPWDRSPCLRIVPHWPSSPKKTPCSHRSVNLSPNFAPLAFSYPPSSRRGLTLMEECELALRLRVRLHTALLQGKMRSAPG